MLRNATEPGSANGELQTIQISVDQTAISPKISAVVCTCNNARSLEATLASLAKQQFPPVAGYEVWIVDNNSSDDTATVARKFTECEGSVFRCVFERAQGLSFARNRGTKEARGEVIAFIDDDAVADPDWLAQLWATYQREPSAACVGGKVVLQFPSASRPEWYDTRLDGYLSARDLPYGQARSEKDFPHGTNISFRKSELERLGGFHPLLGARMVGGVKLQGDETQLCLRLLRSGKSIWFQPAARVVHVVSEARLCKEYFLGLAQTSGYVRVMLDNHGAIGVSTFAQLRRYFLRYVRLCREHRRVSASLSPADRFSSEVTLRCCWASVWYCLVAKRKLRRLAQELETEQRRTNS